MTALDMRFPYQELLMEAAEPARIPVQPLPTGYSWADQPSKYREGWAQTAQAVGFVSDPEEGEKLFDAMYQSDPADFDRHFFVVLDPEGRFAGSCGHWPGQQLEGRRRLHYLMVDPKQQGRKLANALIGKVAANFASEFAGPLYLSTQAQSWPAIRLYEKLGFAPYTSAWSKRSAEEAQADWKQARRQIADLTGYLV